MKSKVIGWTLIAGVTTLLFLNIEKFRSAYYTFFYRAEHFQLEDYLVSVAHPLLYLVIFYIGVSLGIDYIKLNDGVRLKNKKIVLALVMMMWLVLELPLYKCDFYGVRHSFWKSQSEHFH